jgi:Fur family ferric uptake transcriptional regulator
VTRQRLIVLEAVYGGGGHTAIGDIYTRARREDPKIDLSTIYRALRVFTDLGIVLTAPSGEGEQLYEVRHATPHHHLVCRTCGKEFPLPDDIAAGMVRRVEEESGFSVDLDHLVLWGTCRACRTRKRE